MPAGHLSDELSAFVESGVSILLATRDATLRPDCVRAQGARLGADRSYVTVLLPEAMMKRSLENLRNNGQVAVTFSRIVNHQSIQIKGECLAVRPGDSVDRATQERYRDAWFSDLERVGMPRGNCQRVGYSPCVAVDVSIRDIFVQTPGPEAGRPLP
jgi:hypothetical protein